MDKVDHFVMIRNLRKLQEHINSRSFIRGVFWAFDVFLEETKRYNYLDAYSDLKDYKEELITKYSQFPDDSVEIRKMKKESLDKIGLIYLTELDNYKNKVNDNKIDKFDSIVIAETIHITEDILIDIMDRPYIFLERIELLLKHLEFYREMDFYKKMSTFVDDLKREYVKNAGGTEFKQCKRDTILFIRGIRFEFINNLKVKFYVLGEDKSNYFVNQTRKMIYLNNLEDVEKIDIEEDSMNVLCVMDKDDVLINACENKGFDKIYYNDQIENDLYDFIDTIKIVRDDNYAMRRKVQTYAKFNDLSLKYRLNTYKSKIIDVVFVGSSYARCSIREELYTLDTAKLANSGLDMYYSYKFVRKIIGDSKYSNNIKKCVIVVGYWSLHNDNASAMLKVVRNTYNACLKDINHLDASILIDAEDDILLDYQYEYILKYLINMHKLQYEIFKTYDEKILKYLEFGDDVIQGSTKIRMGKMYTSRLIKDDSKLFKNNHTLEKHKKILQEFVDYLNDKNIEPIILVAPFHKDYLDGLGDNKRFLEENLPIGDYRFIDLNKVPELKFEDDDFLNASHTNMNGAKKVADFLNPILNS